MRPDLTPDFTPDWAINGLTPDSHRTTPDSRCFYTGHRDTGLLGNPRSGFQSQARPKLTGSNIVNNGPGIGECDIANPISEFADYTHSLRLFFDAVALVRLASTRRSVLNRGKSGCFVDALTSVESHSFEPCAWTACATRSPALRLTEGRSFPRRSCSRATFPTLRRRGLHRRVVPRCGEASSPSDFRRSTSHDALSITPRKAVLDV